MRLAPIPPTDTLRELRCLGFLHEPLPRSGIWCGPDLYPRILLPPDLCLGILQGPDFCLRILHGPELSVLLHRPNPFADILYYLRWGILYGLYGPDLCSGIFLGRPSLELLH